ncbi:phosphatidylserine decarboxylase 1 [Coemansia sp. RSA 1722]|nr:phosphatidylserine decarboxylase 1 [Coemansia sp. RSA 486]KAJ2232297.1 phosphatidylserine decarboxylase 1 [Coemansia sp. RSA 485]KAJ2602786.1 phosphatidylserine decarboxylase 1 [Coemansia sp. RSA 1721]KAJ2606752.1 phosphatidylserine decarboxylase 1 [Coemansia sp. RSA 1722]KAJ2639876.1 phosphatidylserine decarboxylase 1 [Coemansia sp. RSA 1286]
MSSMFGGRHALRAAASRAIPSATRHRIPAVVRQHSRQYSRGPNPKQGTRTHWYWIPVGAGLAYISAQRLYHLKSDHSVEPSADGVTVPGPWQLHVLSALPLKAISRFFGSFNELEIPVVLRSPLLRIYATIFGCQLDEMKDPVLTHYPNLATFFYRELKDGVRPINADANVVVSPSDGKVLHFGVVEQREVEQVKGLTYSLDAFFGRPEETSGIAASTMVDATLSNSHNATADDDFAVVNGIPYTLDTLIGPDALTPALQSLGTSLRDHERLFFCVIYLAPGDYHRFHSPVNWVVEARRHFAGELYSVSPYIARTVGNLFVLNERVALLGRWKHGFMSMTAVGATNVGSVVVNFDKELRTNLKEGKVVPGDFSQLSYRMINPALAGVPLRKGQEVGGFRLGSTVVLVFSAPQEFTFDVKADQTVRMGEALGTVPTE